MKRDIGAPRRFATSGIGSVEKVDNYTVRFRMPKPWPPLLQNLVHVKIVPKNYIQKVGDKEFGRQPVGAGPLKFVKASFSEEIVMERYDKYYGGADELKPVGPALLDRVVFKIMPEASSRVAALLASEVQIIEAVPPHLNERLKANPNVAVQICGGTRPKFMDLNTTKPPFNDLRVRRAFSYGIDSQTLLAIIQGGYGAQPPTPAWGSMISEGRDFLLTHWCLSTLPGVVLLILILSLNLFGEGLRDILDPWLKTE